MNSTSPTLPQFSFPISAWHVLLWVTHTDRQCTHKRQLERGWDRVIDLRPPTHLLASLMHPPKPYLLFFYAIDLGRASLALSPGQQRLLRHWPGESFTLTLGDPPTQVHEGNSSSFLPRVDPIHTLTHTAPFILPHTPSWHRSYTLDLSHITPDP